MLITLPPFGVCVVNHEDNDAKPNTSINLLLTPHHHGCFAGRRSGCRHIKNVLYVISRRRL